MMVDLDAALAAIENERLHDNNGTEGDLAYNQAIDDVLAAVAALRGSAPPTGPSVGDNLIAYCDARIEKLLIARDKAKEAGRVGVERCRQSDIETLLKVREVVLAETARAAAVEPAPMGTREPDAWLREYQTSHGEWIHFDVSHVKFPPPNHPQIRDVPLFRATPSAPEGATGGLHAPYGDETNPDTLYDDLRIAAGGVTGAERDYRREVIEASRYPEPMCRDCADFGPTCPRSKEPCDPFDRALVMLREAAASRVAKRAAAAEQPRTQSDEWLREYERRKLALIEEATVTGMDGANPNQDPAEQALDEWVITEQPRTVGSRELRDRIAHYVQDACAEVAMGDPSATTRAVDKAVARILAAAPEGSPVQREEAGIGT